MTDVEHPASFAQERIWTTTRLAGDDSSYNMTVALRLAGELDADRLAAAVVSTVAAHPALRTGFASRGGTPVQVVRPAPDWTVTRSEAADEDAVRAQLLEDFDKPFDLTAPPLVRARLIRLGEHRHVFALCTHHIVSDGWSIGVLLTEVADRYAGRPVTAPSATYAQYASAQRAALDPARLAELREHWRASMSGAPDVLALPVDRQRTDEPTADGATASTRLTARTRDAVAALAAAEGTTLFTVLLAGFAAVLSRFGAQDDVVVGTSVADRFDAAFDDVVGLFVDTVVLRVDLAGRPTFRELLARAQDGFLDSLAHKDLPFEQLVGLLAPARSAAVHPVFQAMLTLRAAADVALWLPGVEITELAPPGTIGVPFDLSLELVDRADGLDIDLRYRTALFDADTATRLVDALRVVLASAAAEPDRPVTLLPVLPPDERQRLLAGAPRDPLPVAAGPDDCAAALVEDQAARTPDALAVSADGATLTYRELDERANRLAHRLVREGVGPETAPVGIAARRGIEFVVAVQAVWRAGGAFVPLDPGQPADRQRAVLRQACCAVVLVDAHGRRGLAEVPGASTVLVDVDPAAHEHEPSTRLRRRCLPNALAYVLFTSGTTGAPKGAMVTHDGMLNHALAKNADVAMTPADVLAQNGPATFDVVVWQCWAPLLAGGRVHVVPDGAANDPQRLADELAAGRVTVLQAVPAVIGLLLTLAPGDERLATLRWLVSTGDALPTDLARRWAAAYPGIALLNTYGVTECSDDQYHGTVHTGPDGPATPIAPIGAPLANVTGYLLDGEGQPVPVGVPGELYLGGLGVGRGYLGQPGLTASRFVPDPYGAPGARLYRTGDEVRRRPGDVLEFLGRNDFQVKVRGFRVEPAEVEAALCGHPAVREAVVVGHGAAGPDRLLVGYVVPAGERVPVADLHGFLAEVLPPYLVPHHLIWLDAIPVTRNGKTDRAALPAPETVVATPSAPVPLDSVDAVVAEVWRDVLGRAELGAHDELFHVGGTSLLAVTLLDRLHAACGVRLNLAELLRDATVSGTAAAIRLALRDGRSAPSRDPIPTVDRAGPVAASFAQERLWVTEQVAATPALYVVPFTIAVPFAVDDAGVAAAVAALVDRHEALRTGLVGRDGRPVQVVHAHVSTPLTTTDLSTLDPAAALARARDLLTADARAGFDLARPPLLRIHALRLPADELLLGVVVHHAVTDAWSNDVLVRDLLELLRAEAEHRAADLPELPVQYLDHAVWQRDQLTEERQAELLAHWLDRLTGLPELSTLPADGPVASAATYAGATTAATVPADVVLAARALGRSEGATPFMVVLACLYVTLSRYSGQRDLVLGAPVAGREHPQSGDVVGCFVNMVPLRLAPDRGATFRDVLAEVRSVCLDAYAHADVPFETLVDRLRPRRAVTHHPVFQVMVAMVTGKPGTQSRPAAEPFAVGTGTAKFDLSLQVSEVDDTWQVTVEYARDRYGHGTVRRFTDVLGGLVRAAIADADAPITSLPVLPRAQDRAIGRWCDGPVVEPPTATVPELVAAQAAANPAAPAVGMAGEWLSYQDFWTRVTALAGRLRELGAGPDQAIGVCLDRGVDLVVAVHAVLAAGAAYVPLDPGYPADRLRLMVRDSGAAIVLAEPVHHDLIGPAATLVDPGEAGPAAGFTTVSPDCLAYTIYTSGSTGAPKGVQVSHRAVLNRVRSMQDAFRIGPGHRMLHKTPFTFDVSVWELVWPLTAGAALAVAPPDEHRDPDRLLRRMAAERVGVVNFVPSMLGPFLDAVARAGRPAGLEHVVCTGEALPPALADRCHRELPGVHLHNFYGPTEAAVEVSWQPVAAGGSVVPIGRPLPNTRMVVLDDEGGPVPVGVAGELFLGGVQLARGYAGQPGRTAERFLPDHDGQRRYATGDVARWRPDGTVEWLRRVDDQVKIRGFRVEPAEVEAALLTHPAVAAAAVVANSGQLVAYLVATPEAEPPTPAAVRKHLAGRLPDHLVPSLVVALAALPLTSSGKLDRAALPEPVVDRAASGTEYVEPADGTEQALAGIWSRVLGVDRIGARDNFFDLGGDSILGLLVVSRAVRAGLEVTPRQLFEHQTILELAPFVGRPAPARPSAPVGVDTGVDTAVFGRVVAMLRTEDERIGRAE